MANSKKPNNYNKNTDPTKKSVTSSKAVTGNNVPKQTGPEYTIPENKNDTRSLSKSTKAGRLFSDEELSQLESVTDSTPLAESVENTPNAQGVLPEDARLASKDRAAAIIREDNEDVKQEQASETASAFYIGSAPHYFSEQDYQVFYHDVVVYIQGVDVSQWLEGSVSIKYNINTDPNTCDFTLNNAANRFVLTPENLTGVWRRSDNSLNNDYDESAKEDIFRFKSDPRYNAPDPVSNGLIWPLNFWGLIFHKYDPIRVWIRNPAAREVEGQLADEWLPVFTGYLTSFPKRDNHINAGSSLQLHAEDIRTVIKNMRVNTNAYVYATKGAEVRDPSTSQSTGTTEPNRLRFGKSLNVQYDRTFFKDLLIQGGTTDDPWSDLTFPEVVEALTFNEDAQVVVNGARNRRSREIEATIKNKIAEINLETDSKKKAALETDLAVLKQAQNTRYGNPEAGGSTDTPNQGTSDSTTGETTRTQNKSMPNSSRLGRMQRGFFRGSEKFKVVYPDANDREDQIDFMESWYSLCAFGSTKRDADDYLRFDLGDLRYWKLDEVKKAGANCRTTFSWAPDAQAIHMIEPGTSSTALPIFQEVKVINSDNAVATTRGFTNRLDILNKACDIVDYRFWVTGTGDIVFEFPQYDFNPTDYGRWADVLTFDYHVLEEDLSEEEGEIPTVMVGTKTVTGNASVPDPQGLNTFTDTNQVVVWIPSLAARIGIHKDDVTFNRITDKNRLIQLTYMALQKKIGTFTKYRMTTSYRPWVSPNRPVFNKYRSKYALTESVSFMLPVTAGSRAGNTAPTTDLTLNYIRSIDVLGTPRYITGGPSMPIFYGEKKSSSLVSSLNKAVTTLDNFFEQLKDNSNSLTSQALRELRDIYGSFLPAGQDTYNVIDVPVLANQVAAVAPNQTEELNRSAVAARASLDQLQNKLDDKRSKGEINKAVKEAQAAIKDLAAQFSKINVDYTPIVSTEGLLPNSGISGFRHDDYIEPKDRPIADITPVALENTCTLDQYQFSSPLGRAASDLKFGNAVIQYAESFPRTIMTSYGQKSLAFPGLPVFNGVDFIAKTGENVYAVGNGRVLSITDSETFGSTIAIAHDNGYITSYSPVKPIVSVGADITRNEIIGTLQSSKRSTLMGLAALHFQTGTGASKDGIVGYAKGSAKTYVFTEEDVQWLIRAVIGESGKNTADMAAVASCMITRFVFKNDESLARRNTQLWSSFTEMLVGAPPYGRGYSQPVAYYWRTAESPPDGKKPVANGNRKPESLKRRKEIRSLGTPEGKPFPSEVEALIRDLCSGRRPLVNGEGVIDFRAPSPKFVPEFLANNAKIGVRVDNTIPGTGNVFFSVEASRRWKSQGYPQIQSFAPSDFKLTFYAPTNSGLGSNPGVPNKVYTVNQPTKNAVEGWKNNKVLIVGSLASTGLGPELAKQLTQRKATVEIFPHIGGLPGSTGSSRDLLSTDTKKQLEAKLKGFKPDVTFVMYGASNLTNQQLSLGMLEAKEVILKAGSDIWWVGPPTYDESLSDIAIYRPIYEQEGVNVFGDRYISSGPFTSPRSDRTADLLNVTPVGAVKWANGVRQATHGKNKDETNGKPSSQISGGGWDGAIPPEDCPPTKQLKYPPLQSRTGTNRTPVVNSKYSADSLDLLLPSFRSKVVQLIANMTAAGYDPIARDTGRTPAESAANAQEGTGIVNSLHEYGAGVDIISASKGWKDPAFFQALGQHAEALGLIWGGRFSRRDFPHVQAIPVQKQNQLRNLPVSQRDAFVASILGIA